MVSVSLNQARDDQEQQGQANQPKAQCARRKREVADYSQPKRDDRKYYRHSGRSSCNRAADTGPFMWILQQFHHLCVPLS